MVINAASVLLIESDTMTQLRFLDNFLKCSRCRLVILQFLQPAHVKCFPDTKVDPFNCLFLQVFLKGPSLYAFKGLAGRFAPIGVHFALLLVMAGGTLSSAGSFRGSVTVPQGLNFVVGDILGPSGFLSKPSEAFNTEVHVNRFYMDYYDSGEVICNKNKRNKSCSSIFILHFFLVAVSVI